MSMSMKTSSMILTIAASALPLLGQTRQPVTGQAAFADWAQVKPGVRRKISVADLPKPDRAQSVRNQPHIVARPENAWPVAPLGFKVTLYAGATLDPVRRLISSTRSSGAACRRAKVRSSSHD